jgi:inorganic pyrophosphatase
MSEKNTIFHTIPAGKNPPKEVNVIVEISKGSRIKYEFEETHGTLFIDRFLHTPIPYPFSYGLIPQTWNDFDHDPLDAVIISDESIMSGCVVPCRVIGMLSVDDSGERDDKVLCVPVGDPYSSHLRNFKDLSAKKREDIEYFMCHYKDLEKGKSVVVKSWDDAETSERFIGECIECYKKKFA